MAQPCHQIENIIATKTRVDNLEDILAAVAKDVRCIREKMWNTKGFIVGVMISGSIVGGIVSFVANYGLKIVEHAGR